MNDTETIPYPPTPQQPTTGGSGNKYHRAIADLGGAHTVEVDVYAVPEAFGVACPARAHAVKKLLCAGLRGKADAATDLCEARDAVERAIGLERCRGALTAPPATNIIERKWLAQSMPPAEEQTPQHD